jgi:hypothetical protein
LLMSRSFSCTATRHRGNHSTMSNITALLADHDSRRPTFRNQHVPPLDRNPAGNCHRRLQGDDGRDYFLKWSRTAGGAVPDIVEREECISLLGQAVGVSILESWAVELPLPRKPGVDTGDLIRDRCSVADYVPEGSLADFISRGGRPASLATDQREVIADLLAFSMWVGDDDRGIVDIMLPGGRITYGDNALCGPGRDRRLRSAHPHPQAFTQADRWRMCFCAKKSFVEWVLSSNRDVFTMRRPAVIDCIERLSDDDIRRIVSHCGLFFAATLMERRQNLATDYLAWLAAAPPP